MQKYRIALKVLSASLLLATAGCSFLSSMNPFASKPSTRNSPAPLVEFKQTMNARTAWTASVGKAGNYAFSPVLVRNDLYTAAADGTITRLDATNGQSLWRINAGMPLTSGVGSDCLLYTSPSPRDRQKSRMPSSA